MRSSDGALACFFLFFLAFINTLVMSARTESAQAVKRTWLSESVTCRALRRLSVRARRAAMFTSASLGFLLPKKGSLVGSFEHPPNPKPIRRTSAKALRATGLSFRSGSLDVGANLELGLQHGPRAVAQRLRRAAVGSGHGEIVWHDDPLQTGHI